MFCGPPTASIHASLNGNPGWMPFAPRPTRDIASTPPAMARSSCPDATAAAAEWSACCDEPHWLSTVTAGTSHGSPAAIHALRVTFTPCSPVCVTHPPNTSSMCMGSTPVRSSSPCSTAPSRSVGCSDDNLPFFLPIGLRTAPTMYASVMSGSLPSCLLCRLAHELGELPHGVDVADAEAAVEGSAEHLGSAALGGVLRVDAPDHGTGQVADVLDVGVDGELLQHGPPVELRPEEHHVAALLLVVRPLGGDLRHELLHLWQ